MGFWNERNKEKRKRERKTRSIYLSIYLSIFLSIHPSNYLSIFLSIYPSIYLSIYLSTYLSIHLSILSGAQQQLPRSLQGRDQLKLNSKEKSMKIINWQLINFCPIFAHIAHIFRLADLAISFGHPVVKRHRICNISSDRPKNIDRNSF